MTAKSIVPAFEATMTMNLIRDCNDKESIEKITIDLMRQYNFRLYRGKQISKKTFDNDRTFFIKQIESLKNISKDLKSEYKGHLNHHAVTVAYQYEYVPTEQTTEQITEQPSEQPSEQTAEQTTEQPTKKPAPKKEKAVTLDAQKLIDFAVSLLSSDDYREIGIGVAFLTARRQSEIFFYTTFKADDENTMIVQCLSKKRGDNFDNAYRIPVLCNSDLIENAVERMRKIKPMHELYQIVSNSKNIELGLKTAREKFNNSYNKSILEQYNEVARPLFKDFENIIDNKDDYFHGLRAASASIWYYLHDSLGYSVENNIDFVKHALAHDTDGIAQRYTKFKFVNLPDIKSFDESVFDIGNINEVKIEKVEDKVVELNLTKLIQKLDMVSQQNLSEMLQQSDNLETVLANFISKATQAKMVSNAVGNGDNVKPDARNKIGNIVMAMINYNATQKDLQDPKFIYISASKVGDVASAIFGKNIDPKTLRATVDNLSTQIEESYKQFNVLAHLKTRSINGVNEYTNNHIRGDKMIEVMEKITAIYESM